MDGRKNIWPVKKPASLISEDSLWEQVSKPREKRLLRLSENSRWHGTWYSISTALVLIDPQNVHCWILCRVFLHSPVPFWLLNQKCQCSKSIKVGFLFWVKIHFLVSITRDQANSLFHSVDASWREGDSLNFNSKTCKRLDVIARHTVHNDTQTACAHISRTCLRCLADSVSLLSRGDDAKFWAEWSHIGHVRLIRCRIHM